MIAIERKFASNLSHSSVVSIPTVVSLGEICIFMNISVNFNFEVQITSKKFVACRVKRQYKNYHYLKLKFGTFNAQFLKYKNYAIKNMTFLRQTQFFEVTQKVKNNIKVIIFGQFWSTLQQLLTIKESLNYDKNQFYHLSTQRHLNLNRIFMIHTDFLK
jgi:hypothetical protein